VDHARRKNLHLPTINAAEEIATNGVLATLEDGTQARVGKPTFIEEATGAIETTELRPGETAVYVSSGTTLAGVIVLSDPLRANAAETIARLREQDVDTIAMVTGDVQATAESIAAQA